MKLNRSSLRRMILNEIRQLNEEASGYDALSAEDRLYAQVGYVDRAIQKVSDLRKRARFSDLFLSDCQSIKAAIDAGKAAEWEPNGKGPKGVFAGAVLGLKKYPSYLPGMVKNGKYIIDRTK